MKNSVISTWITSLYVSQPSSVVFACQTAHFGPEFQVSMGPSPHLRFLHTKQRVLVQNFKSLWVPALICGFCIPNCEFWSEIAYLYGSQNSPVIFCMQNSVPSFRIASLYRSQPSSVVFAWKTATYGPEKQVSMGPRHDLSFCGCKTAWLASEILVSIGRSTHVWFLDAKQRLLDQNNKSLRVADKSCRFVHGKQQL